MASLTNEDYGFLRDYIFSDRALKAEMKNFATLPSKAEFKAAFQAIEDDWSTRQLTIKAALDVGLGRTTTNAQAKVFRKAWLALKVAQGG